MGGAYMASFALYAMNHARCQAIRTHRRRSEAYAARTCSRGRGEW